MPQLSGHTLLADRRLHIAVRNGSEPFVYFGNDFQPVFRSQFSEQLPAKVALVQDQAKRARVKLPFGIPAQINKSVAPFVASLIHVLFEPEFGTFDQFRRWFKGEELMVLDVPASSNNQGLQCWRVHTSIL